MRDFLLGSSVHENVQALRVALGSRTRALSLLDFARLLNARDGRKRAASTIQKWEQGAEPDLVSIRIMAELAGVSFEEFALGRQRRSGAAAAGPADHLIEPEGVPADEWRRQHAQDVGSTAAKQPPRKKGA